MPFQIQPWERIAGNYRGTVLLGNGASIAVCPTFSYRSLLDHAIERHLLTADVDRLFTFFDTSDFELILRIVWQAANVNRSLQIPDDRTHAAYTSVRDCLIQTVRQVHPEYGQIQAHLPNIYRYLKGFDTVITLNYDLLVYWAMTYGLNIDDGHAFKDCFVWGAFSDDWRSFIQPIGGHRTTTLVFYPHGSLVLCRNRVEQELKIHNEDQGLLGAILQRWQSEEVVPLFVSEGTWQQKVASIKNSNYLSTIYREVLTSRRQSLVVYGWSFGAQDLHLLHRMRGTGIQNVAVSVYGQDQMFCNMAHHNVRDALGNVVVEFFDSESPGCWTHAPQGNGLEAFL